MKIFLAHAHSRSRWCNETNVTLFPVSMLWQQLTQRWRRKLNVPLTNTLAHGTLGHLSRLFDVTLRMSGGGFWYRGTWAGAEEQETIIFCERYRAKN